MKSEQKQCGSEKAMSPNVSYWEFKSVMKDKDKLYNKANLVVTFTILIASMYISLVAIIGKPIFHPYTNSSSSTDSTMYEITSSTFSVFFLWISSLVVGYFVTHIRLPSLFGALCVGVFVKHVHPLADLLYVDEYWHFIVRKLCLVVIIIRWGLGINGTYIRKNPTYPLALGVLSAFAEAIAISCVSIFLFKIRLEFGIISGFLLATVSPAICGPVMLKLQQQQLGTDKSIPCFVPAACCFDNTFSIIFVTLTSAVTFTNESKFSIFVSNVGEIVLCGFIGIFIGWVLWYFPLANQKSTHTCRILLLIFLSTGIILGMNALNHAFPGIVACLLACFVAPSRWRTDNPKKIEPIANFFAYLWCYVASPMLFSLVGTLLDFTEIPGNHVLAAFVLVMVGILARLASGFAIVICSPLTLGEQFVVVWSLVPKATVQAAIGPNLLTSVENFPQFKQEAVFVVASCILTVAITAPIGAFILDIAAPRLLGKARAQTNQIAVADLPDLKKSLPTIAEECGNKGRFKRMRAFSLQYGNAFKRTQ